MVRIIFFSLAFLLLFTSCGNNRQQFEHAGGTLSLCVESTFLSKEPSEIGDYYSQMILGQVFEGLMSLDPTDLSPRPQLAKSYRILDEGLTYEFELRDDVQFHSTGGLSSQVMSASDVIYSVEKACSKRVNDIPSTAYSTVFKGTLIGADEYYEGKAESISGVSTKGNTVTFRLIKEDVNFLQKLSLTCCAILSRKLDERDEIIGTGPYIIKSDNISNDKIVLVKNEDYYMNDEAGNALPYMDSIELLLGRKKLQQLELFENGQIDFILGLPTSRITKMLEGRIDDFNSEPPLFILHDNPQLVTNYYHFNFLDERFQDIRVRKAFNHAINKEKIGRSILRNQYSEMGNYGMVPPLRDILRGYNFEKVGKYAHDYDPELAKQLLAEAGYPEGQGFGSVNLRFNIDDIHSAVADEISKQLRQNLNINVNIDGSTFPQLTRDADRANGDLFRAAWAADYPSPESFLVNFYGKLVPDNPEAYSFVNNSRYKSDKFDKYFEKGREAGKMSERRNFYSMADQQLLKDAAFIPLWYNGEIQIMYAKVRNLHFNPMDLFDFRRVYIKEWTKEEYLANRKKPV